MNTRIASIMVGSIVFSAIVVGFSRDQITDSPGTTILKFILAAVIWGVVLHFSMKRLGR